MNAEQLISMAAAKGIDLVTAAQQSTDRPRKDTATRTRLGVKITQLLESPAMLAYGRETRSMVEAEWSPADVGLALAGLGTPQTMAALFAWAGATQNHWPLVIELRRAATRLRWRENWPMAIQTESGGMRDYLERLSEMVLFDDQHPGVLDFTPPARIGQAEQKGILRALFCDVALADWYHHLAGPYARVWSIWAGWLDEAARRVQSKLREGEDG